MKANSDSISRPAAAFGLSVTLPTRQAIGAFSLAVALLLTIFPLPTTAVEQWVSTWPPGQVSNTITALAVAPSNGHVIYAATSMAVYRSTDAGASWRVASSLANVVTLAVDPKNHSVVYAYTWPRDPRGPQEPRGLRKSLDGGATWNDPSGGALATAAGPVEILAVHPTNPQILFTGSRYSGRAAQILRSVDGGDGWQSVYTVASDMGVGGVRSILIPPTGNVVYAATEIYHGGSVLRGDDGGTSWRALSFVMPLSFPAALVLDPTDPNVIYAAYQAPTGAGVHIFRSSDGGASWTGVTQGLPVTGTSGPRLAADQLDPRVLYLSLMGDNGGVFRTVDGGDSWTRFAPDIEAAFKYVRALDYSGAAQMIFAGTTEGVWQREVWPEIADVFASYYSSHDGWRVLGRPISPPSKLGNRPAQYFEKGRLEDHSQEIVDPNWKYMYGLLVDELQQARVKIPVGGDASTLSYATIYLMAAPDRRINPPDNFTSGIGQNPDGSAFVPYHAQLAREAGHNVPSVFWEYINRADLFPGGWLHDVGLPMTEAAEATVDKGEVKGRKILVQAFQRTVLTYDPQNPLEWQVERANVGADYVKGIASQPPR